MNTQQKPSPSKATMFWPDVTPPNRVAPTAEALSLAFREIDLTQYHEAGHAVAFHLLDFKPRRITYALAEHDRRSCAFFRTRGGFLETPLARERVQNYAVCCIAGIAAETRFGGVPITELRQTSGLGDYETVHAVLDRLMLCRGVELCPEVRAAHMHLWEARAVALMSQTHVWAAIESVASELQVSAGVLERGDLVAAIERGTREELTARLNATRSASRLSITRRRPDVS
jgi:hypothetical protein